MLIIKHSLAIRMLELDRLRFDSLPLASWWGGGEKKKQNKTRKEKE